MVKFIRFDWVLLLCSLLNAFSSSQEQVKTIVGRNVLLPCIYPGQLTSVVVFWRGRDDAHLYDIVNSQPVLSALDPSFQNRTTSFPEFYNQGNFSVLLSRVTPQDAGIYECHIPTAKFTHQLELVVRDGAFDGKTGSGTVALRCNQATLLLLSLGQTLHFLWRN